MKKRLNILCVLALLVLAYPVVESAILFARGVSMGVESAMQIQDDKDALQKLGNLKPVALLPTDVTLRDSVLNTKTGEYVPVIYMNMNVSIDAQPDSWWKVITVIMSVLSIVIVVSVIYLFVRLVISVNKSDIFNWKNVSRLRFIGSGLCLNFAFTFAYYYLSNSFVGDAFSIQGYELYPINDGIFTGLILALVAFIVAEVFAIGLRMKEEQELTI